MTNSKLSSKTFEIELFGKEMASLKKKLANEMDQEEDKNGQKPGETGIKMDIEDSNGPKPEEMDIEKPKKLDH